MRNIRHSLNLRWFHLPKYHFCRVTCMHVSSRRGRWRGVVLLMWISCRFPSVRRCSDLYCLIQSKKAAGLYSVSVNKPPRSRHFLSLLSVTACFGSLYWKEADHWPWQRPHWPLCTKSEPSELRHSNRANQRKLHSAELYRPAVSLSPAHPELRNIWEVRISGFLLAEPHC